MKKWEKWESDWPQSRIDRMWGRYMKQEAWRVSSRYVLPAEYAVSANAESILDIGCGGGLLYKAVTELSTDVPINVHYVGIDITPKMIVCARRLFPDAIFTLGDAAKLPYSNSQFDLCVISHVLEHQPPDRTRTIISEAMAVARKAVIIVFFIPPSGRIPGAARLEYDPEGFYINTYSHDWLIQTIRTADENCRIEWIGHRQENDDNTFYVIEKR